MATHRFHKTSELIAHEKERFRKLKALREAGAKEVAEVGKKEALALLSGAVLALALRGAFSTGEGSSGDSKKKKKQGGSPGSVPLLPIGVHSGKLKNSLRLIEKRKGDDVSYELVVQGVGYAKYVLSAEGTKKAIARGLKAAVKEKQKERMLHFVRIYVDEERS